MNDFIRLTNLNFVVTVSYFSSFLLLNRSFYNYTECFRVINLISIDVETNQHAVTVSGCETCFLIKLHGFVIQDRRNNRDKSV